MKKVIATVIEKNEYRIQIDVENDATEDEIREAILHQLVEDSINPFGALFRRFRKQS